MDCIQKIMDVLHLAENLKKELRHRWLSNQRQESVAEHTWRFSLMATN
ncbi:5'-deoxynucleotidase YfbR-like HD superfamily hydrolase [Pullulanibacillus pueri]|nr:5'-deoxynucleotidase YfbR-like HD superfamily hydrolase [Pullulanibacillus pueri]